MGIHHTQEKVTPQRWTLALPNRGRNDPSPFRGNFQQLTSPGILNSFAQISFLFPLHGASIPFHAGEQLQQRSRRHLKGPTSTRKETPREPVDRPRYRFYLDVIASHGNCVFSARRSGTIRTNFPAYFHVYCLTVRPIFTRYYINEFWLGVDIKKTSAS